MTDQIKKQQQLQFSKYLKEFRALNQMTQGDLANHLGCNISRVGLMESSSTDNRLISSLEFIRKLADLQGMKISEFVSLLEAHPVQKSAEGWQCSLKREVSKLPAKTQRDLLDVLLDLNPEELKRGLRLIKLASKPKTLDALEHILTKEE